MDVPKPEQLAAQEGQGVRPGEDGRVAPVPAAPQQSRKKLKERGSWWEKEGAANPGRKDISPLSSCTGLGFHPAAPPRRLGHMALCASQQRIGDSSSHLPDHSFLYCPGQWLPGASPSLEVTLWYLVAIFVESLSSRDRFP